MTDSNIVGFRSQKGARVSDDVAIEKFKTALRELLAADHAATVGVLRSLCGELGALNDEMQAALRELRSFVAERNGIDAPVPPAQVN